MRSEAIDLATLRACLSRMLLRFTSKLTPGLSLACGLKIHMPSGQVTTFEMMDSHWLETIDRRSSSAILHLIRSFQ